ncbi:MAG: polyphosphate:AMP phosphotransferase [Candidatus Hydrogenedentes bacterium]|nr:polyphosphate:AMP phosphotransferase [Candidatus Hydrogenedentota bacterium]
MLETIDVNAELSKKDYQKLVESIDVRLGECQRAIREAGIPVIIVFEGWEAAGKGTAIGRLLQHLDPRGYKVHLIKPANEEELLRPPMWRFWNCLPSDGAMGIFEGSWYRHVLQDRVKKLLGKREWESAYERARTFERQLTDDGAVILKFWLHITQQEQAKRFKKLEKDPALAWKVKKEDWRQHKAYAKYLRAVEDMLRETSTANAPWTVVPTHCDRYASAQIAQTLLAAMSAALDAHGKAKAAPPPQPVAQAKRMDSVLDRVDLSRTVPRAEYERLMPKLQLELRRLEHLIYIKRIPVVIMYEGWDAAGKGGNIKRLTHELDRRGVEVISIAAPEGEEKRHHYLWRFWRHVPKAGHITIFDRSWYGRVLVERVEGFAAPAEWQRAYREINEFEAELTSFGAVLVKFWVHLSGEEQLKRFELRQEIPYKQWKLTEEDWRNREKWQDYYLAVSDMIEKTSTLHAPWTIIEGNDKRHARLKAIRTVNAAVANALKKR